MKILVTGGAGFIGSNLCDALLERNYEVHCMDNLLTGKYSNISHLMGNPRFTFFETDIRSKDSCKEAMNGCDVVAHLAALGSVPRSINDPLTTNSINIDGFLNVIQTAKEFDIKRFIFAASSSTYGDSDSLPKVENIIGNPLSPYAVGKYVNELYAHVYAINYGLTYIGLRYFNVFGKRQDPNGAYAAVIPKFIQQFLDNEAPTINGDGTNTRDFTHIENVVEATVLAIENTKADADNQIYNVAYGSSTSLIELSSLIKDAINAREPQLTLPNVTYGPFRKGDIPHSMASIEKIQKCLGYTPKVSVKDGIQETVDWILSLQG
ncbi:MAG: SDR family oxidoreductase [Flavobacteriales bacterium]